MEKQLRIFDMNGTITNTPWADGEAMHVLPGRKEFIEWLLSQGNEIAVVSNQGGLLWRIAAQSNKYPTPESFATEIIGVIAELPPQVRWYFAIFDPQAAKKIDVSTLIEELENLSLRVEDLVRGHVQGARIRVGIRPDWRKPCSGMIEQAIIDAGVEANAAVMIGDRDEDVLAAHFAGVDFDFPSAVWPSASESVPVTPEDLPF